MNPLLLTGEDLSIDAIGEVVYQHRSVGLSEAARMKIIKSHHLIQDIVGRGEVVYGVNTGFGKLCDVRITPEDTCKLQVNLLRSHACGVDEPFSEPETRAALLIRANSLAKGYSGTRINVIETIIEMLNRGVYPVVPCRGSVSASGDLAPSAHLGLVLIGEGEAFVKGKRKSGADAMKAVSLETLVLGPKEGLSILNGTHFTTGLGSILFLQAQNLIDTADVAGAMSLEPLLGTRTAFDPRIQMVRAHKGQQTTAANVLKLIEGSAIVASHKDCGRIQDAYSLRCIPQVHGAVREILAFVRQTLHTEINSATDNPLVFAEDGVVLSGGNFHAALIGYVLDALAIALTDLGNVSERRIERLVNPDLSGLPGFLVRTSGLDSGFMIAQVTAAALASENKILAHPASVDSIPTSANKEDHVSMGMAAGLKLRQIVANLEHILAIELLCNCQAIDLMSPLKPGFGTSKAYERIRAAVPRLEEDRPLSADIVKIRNLIRGNTLSAILQSIAG